MRRLPQHRVWAPGQELCKRLRGEADAASDLDLLVHLEPGRSLIELGALLAELEAELGAPVDLVTEAGLRPALRERVLRDAVPV